MKKAPAIFRGADDKPSSKRIIGTIIISIAIILAVDSHFSDRELNNTAFSSMLYTGGVMIVGGVLEGKFGQDTSRRRIRRTTRRRRDLE